MAPRNNTIWSYLLWSPVIPLLLLYGAISQEERCVKKKKSRGGIFNFRGVENADVFVCRLNFLGISAGNMVAFLLRGSRRKNRKPLVR